MMSPTCGELQTSGKGFHDVPPDLVVSTQRNSWIQSEKKNRPSRINTERRHSSRPTKQRMGQQIAEIHDKKSLSEKEIVQHQQKSDLVTGHWHRNDRLDVVDSPHSLNKSGPKGDSCRNVPSDMRYGLIPNTYFDSAESSRDYWNLSHVEKWVREQEFLLHKPKDIEPFSSAFIYDTEQPFSHRKDSGQSSSLEGSASIPRKYSRQRYNQTTHEKRTIPGVMRPPPLRNSLPVTDYKQHVNGYEGDYDYGKVYANSTPKSMTPPNYEDSIRALKGSPAVKAMSPRSGNSRHAPTQKLRNGYKELNSNVVLPNYPSFIRVKSRQERTEAALEVRENFTDRHIEEPQHTQESNKFVSTRNLPDVAKEASQSSSCFVRNDLNRLCHTSSNASDNRVVLRRKPGDETRRTVEDRNLKAQSWPKFTVTSVVVPSAKKVKVTPVGSVSSGIIRNEISEGKEKSEGQQPSRDANEQEWTQEERTFLKKYILADEGRSDNSFKDDIKVNEPQVENDAVSSQINSPPNSNMLAVSDHDAVQSSSNTVEVERPVSNLSSSFQAIHSSREAANTVSGVSNQPTQTTESASPLFNSDGTYKAESYPGPNPGEFRQSAGYKRASSGLKDLIRLHEEEIARVAKKDVVRKPSLPLKNRKDSLGHRHTSLGIGMREKTEGDSSNVDTRWKRHTTIGLVNIHEPYFEARMGLDLTAKRPASTNACLSTDVDFDAITPRTVYLDNSVPDENTPPPLPPKPKFFPDSVSSQRPKSLNEMFDVAPRVRNRSRKSEEEARSELEKVTRTLESFRSISIERSEEGCQTEEKIYGQEELDRMTTDLQVSVTKQKAEIERQIVERMELERKLNEQRKVANAYQKLEDRYRRKVHDLQKSLMSCTCGAGFAVNQGKSKSNLNINNTFPRHGKKLTLPPAESEEKTAAKVDGILQELECWLNTQQTSKTSSSEELAAINFQARSLENLRGAVMEGRKARENPPFEIIDDIDATCV